MGKPRIAEEDYRDNEDLLYGDMEGEWVRLPAYTDSHRVSRARDTAVCGVPLLIQEDWWDRFQNQLKKISGQGPDNKGAKKWSPSPWYLAIDRRAEDNHCSPCKRSDPYEESEDLLEMEQAIAKPKKRKALSPAQRTEQTRFLSKVAMVARELGATIMEET